MAQVKKRIYAGDTCDQIVTSIRDEDAAKGKVRQKARFECEEDRRKFNRARALRDYIRLFNNNFSETSLYSTLTFSDEWEVHEFDEARKLRDRFYTRLVRKYPDAKIVIHMGRGKGTDRIHMHMVSDGIPEEFIAEQWKYGKIHRIVHLREHVRYDGVDCGRDYKGLATYLYEHWTEEQGGRRYKGSRKTLVKPRCDERERICRRTYRPDRPPRPPKGFRFFGVQYNRYGWMEFHYIRC